MKSKVKCLKIAIYARTNAISKSDGIMSLDNQVRSLIAWAKENEHKIIKLYQDLGLSGYSRKGPQFCAMLADIDSQKYNINCLAVFDISRLSRNISVINNTQQILEKNSVALFSYLDPIRNSEDDVIDTRQIKRLSTGWFNRENSN